MVKSTRILPAVAAALNLTGLEPSPIAFASPNLLELTHMYQAAQSEPFNLTSHPTWWSVIDNFALGSTFRMDLDRLARMKASDKEEDEPLSNNLSFLMDQGIPQMAVNLLPFFQHLVIKCGSRGVLVAMRISKSDESASHWAQERSNPRQRLVIAHGNAQEIVVLQHFPALPLETVINVTGAGDSFVGSLVANMAQMPHAFQNPESLKNIMASAQQAAILSLQSHSAVSPLLSLRTTT